MEQGRKVRAQLQEEAKGSANLPERPLDRKDKVTGDQAKAPAKAAAPVRVVINGAKFIQDLGEGG